MAIDDAFRIEIDTIFDLMDHFDYYQLLKVDRSATSGQVQAAFFQESRTFHPDRYFGVDDPELKSRVLHIYKRLAEGYAVLKDPEARAAYDRQLETTGEKRFDRTALEAAANRGPTAPELVATTVQGRKFLALGLEALKRKDFNGAVMNLQFALNADPGNKAIQEQLQQAKQQADDKKKTDTSNPYKVRII